MIAPARMKNGMISGSSVADTASIGSVMIPQMEEKGYPRDFAAAVTAMKPTKM
jgi:TRAP-type C4-dicarboxylate transport system permease large subunit